METCYTEIPETSANMVKVMTKVKEQQAQSIGTSMIYPLSAIKQEPIFTLREDTTTLHPYNPYHAKHDPVDILMTSWIKQEPGLSDSMETTNPSISIGGLHENDETNARTVAWRSEEDGFMSSVLLVPDKPEVVSDLDGIKVGTSLSADTLVSHGFESNVSGLCYDKEDTPLPVAMFTNEFNSEGRVCENGTEDLDDGASHGSVSVRGKEGPINKDSERIWKDEKLPPVVTVSTSTDEDTLSILRHGTDNIHRYGTTHAGDKPHMCSTCDYGTEQRSNLVYHVCSDKQHVCPQCDYKTDVRLNMLTHLRTHTGDEQYKCNYCKYRADDNDRFVAHWVLHTLEEKPYKCSICDDTFTKKCYLNDHSTSIHGDKPYSCSMCAYSGRCNTHLIVHMRKHTGEKPYKCSRCDFSASFKNNLDRHRRKHTGDFTTSIKSNLDGHTRKNTGDKPYGCNKCEYKACDIRSLKKHIEFHTVEKKSYKCSRCSYACIYKSSLVVHMRMHTGGKLYSCSLCDYRAVYQCHLNRHMKMHSGEKPYK